jgi:SPP1 gp7 family putative phage head morphogenesis protein
MARNPLRIDPTRTITLRTRAAAVMRRRFMAVGAAVRAVVGAADGLGLAPRPGPVLHADTGDDAAAAAGWRFMSDAGKVAAFMEWLKGQIDAKILEPTDDVANHWLVEFVRPAYRKGVLRAYADTLPAATAPNKSFYEGGRAAFLQTAFNSPVAVSKLRLVYTRAYEQLQGITADMAGQLSRVITNGVARGTHPYDVAKDITDAIAGISRRRAEVLARTEIIYAHAEGQLDSMTALGLEDVQLMAEWSTAGDDRVCPLCDEHEGEIIPIAEAHGMIPLHPNCRCSWLPVATAGVRMRNRRIVPTADVTEVAE